MEQLEDGPLWKTIKRQLYKSEVSHVKRLVGEKLIEQNQIMWDEIASLRQMLTDFQQQNEEQMEGLKKQAELKGQLCGGQHRELLKRQAQILLEDLRSQATSCGHVVEDLVPELRDQQLRDFVRNCSEEDDPSQGSSRPKAVLMPGLPPTTPSTRPSTSSGLSGCSTPEQHMLPVSLGRCLGVDELSRVAEDIREALEAERDALMMTINEQMQCLEVEDQRRVICAERLAVGEPSTAKVQKFVHTLQEVSTSPSLRALTLSGPAPLQTLSGPAPPAEGPVPITGGASVRRLQALIAQRRRLTPSGLNTLGAVPESATHPLSPIQAEGEGSQSSLASAKKPAFDPFFDDPFA